MIGYFTTWMTTAAYVNYTQQNVNGRLVAGTSTETPLQIIEPMPLRAKDIDFLGEGETIRNHYVTWVKQGPVYQQILSDSATNADSRLLWSGSTYRIVSVANRNIGGHYRMIIKKV